MNNGFDKNKFAKAQKELNLCCICIALIGVISIVCSFFAGNGFFHALNNIVKPFGEDQEQQWLDYVDQKTPDEDDSFGEDPQNYYGSYYAEKDLVVYQVDIRGTNATITLTDLNQQLRDSFSCQYADAAYAKATFGKECAVIILYSGSLSNINNLFWLSGSAETGYELVDENQGIHFTTTPLSLDSLMNEPKNYYGTYYASKDYVVDKVEISASKIVVTTSTAMADAIKAEFNYVYYPAKYASMKYQKECDVLVAYKDSPDSAERLFWIEETNGNIGLLGNNNLSYGKDEITFESLVGDPKNYYGNYAFNPNNTLELANTSKAVFAINGVSGSYNYFYADRAWLNLYTTVDYEAALVLYNAENNQMHIFRVLENGNLVYGDQYTFVKQ